MGKYGQKIAKKTPFVIKHGQLNENGVPTKYSII